MKPFHVPVHELFIFLNERLHNSLGSSVCCSDIWEFHPRVLCNASFLATCNTLSNVYHRMSARLLPAVCFPVFHSVHHFRCNKTALWPTETSSIICIWLSCHASIEEWRSKYLHELLLIGVWKVNGSDWIWLLRPSEIFWWAIKESWRWLSDANYCGMVLPELNHFRTILVFLN